MGILSQDLLSRAIRSLEGTLSGSTIQDLLSPSLFVQLIAHYPFA